MYTGGSPARGRGRYGRAIRGPGGDDAAVTRGTLDGTALAMALCALIVGPLFAAACACGRGRPQPASAAVAFALATGRLARPAGRRVRHGT